METDEYENTAAGTRLASTNDSSSDIEAGTASGGRLRRHEGEMQVLRTLGLVSLSAVVVLAAASASAVTFGFGKITNNGNPNVASQLSVDVTDGGAGTVVFTFSNSGPIASSITDIYFDDGTLFGISSITNGAGTSFSQPASPGDLPGGNAVDFNTTGNFSADSDAPVAVNGVNPGEMVAITFTLIGGQTFADTIAAIELALANPGVDVDGGLRMGLHVQAIGGPGGSDSYVTVPEPTGAILFGIGTLLAGAAIRRRS
jgi:hypothetical protein